MTDHDGSSTSIIDQSIRAADRIEELESRLLEIGNFAHDQSTGPAIPDEMWSIRDMAYEMLETPEQRTARIREEVGYEQSYQKHLEGVS